MAMAQAEFKLDDCYPPDHIDEYVRKSLKNSGLERFDLVQFHTSGRQLDG